MKPPPSLRWTQECLPPRDSLKIPRISTLISQFLQPLLVLFMPMSFSLMAWSCLCSWSHWRWRRMMAAHILFQPPPSIHHKLPKECCQPAKLTALPWEDAGDYQEESYKNTWIFSGPCTGEFEVIELGPELKVLIQECQNLLGGNHVIRRAQFTRQFSIARDPSVCHFLPGFQCWSSEHNFGFSDIPCNGCLFARKMKGGYCTQKWGQEKKNGKWEWC